MGCVYQAKNKINGKSYIGATKHTLRFRRKEHKRSSENGATPAFHRALRKYGYKAFKWRTLAESSNTDELDLLEAEFIKKYNTTIPNGYNMTEGGKGDPGYRHTEKHKKWISKVMSGRVLSEKTKNRIRRVRLGTKLSEETKRRIGDSVRGKKNGFYGKHHTEETKAKNALAHVGKKHSEETKRKMSEAHKGKKFSKEHLMNLKIAGIKRRVRVS